MTLLIDLLKSVVFGIVEGITEWLPISSTGHMILLNEFVHMHVSEAFWEMFLVVIQLGAILAVVVLYWNQIFPFDFSAGAKNSIRKDIFQKIHAYPHRKAALKIPSAAYARADYSLY